ncbi:hypothetical protein [Heyndrickxia sp. FSL W8-0423]|uniref:hypothetical protein n=1 Tax=Heyndrickxia sp. FSL W8-0423 TaxID=2921601 RepID=UPI0030F9572A
MEQTLLDLSKHAVSDKTLEQLKEVMYKQDEFGISKYGTALDHSLNYDWDAMADEEIADFLKYRQCAKERKEYIINLLKAGLRSDEPKTFIEVALELLTIRGTGK